jgi:plastocyanin
MTPRLSVALTATAVLGLSAGVATTANAAIPKNEIRIVGGVQVKLGQYVKDNQRFKAADTTVKSGATVTLRNKATTRDPHSISFTQKRYLPGTDFDTPVFAMLGKAHGVPEDNPEGDPTIFVVDDGAAVPAGGTLNVDTAFTPTSAGDSAFIAPGQKEFKFKVTADKGSRLFYFCAIHPWMQGKLTVN